MKKSRVRGIIPHEDGIIVIKRIREIEGRETEYYVFPRRGYRSW